MRIKLFFNAHQNKVWCASNGANLMSYKLKVKVKAKAITAIRALLYL
jgi:hypothetical protein